MAYVDDGFVFDALPPGVPYLYSEWLEQVGEVERWGGAQRFEAALWEARDLLAKELLVGYPRAIRLGWIADRLASAFDGFGGRERGRAVSASGRRTHDLRVVAGSGVVSLLGQAFELLLVRKNDDYEA